MKHPLYPFFLSVFPMSVLMMLNLTQLSDGRLLRPALIMLVLTALLMGLFRLVLLSWDGAAWAVTIFICMVNYQALLWFVIPGALLMVLWKAPIPKKNIYFNMFAMMLLAIPLGYIAICSWKRTPVPIRHVSAAALPGPSNPDIYWIISDSYTSHSILLSRFGYDNSAMLESLQALGFITGDCTSVWNHTEPSLTSTLDRGVTYANPWLAWKEMQHTQVQVALEQRGYHIVSFETGFDWDELRSTSTFIQTPPNHLTDFEAFILLKTLPGFIPPIHTALMDAWSDNYRQRTLGILTDLPRAAALPGPKFVFVHLLPPHPPFVFNADGSLAPGFKLRNPKWNGDSDDPFNTEYTQAVYNEGYINQVQYVDSVLPDLVANILKNSKTDPLIIIQGDHGAWYSQKGNQYAILCAVHNPTSWDVPLEPQHTFDFVYGMP